MKMVPMKLSDEEYAEQTSPASPPAERYPPGLCLCLCDDDLKKLGLLGNIEAGQEVMIQARAKVTSVSQRADAEGEPEDSAMLQIMEMGAEPVREKKRLANLMYGDGE